MKTTEVIKQLLLQIDTDDPKNEALITTDFFTMTMVTHGGRQIER